MNLIIRQMKLEDIPIIVESCKKANWIKSTSTFESYLQEQTSNARLVLIAFKDKSFAGYITIKWQSKYKPFLLNNIPEIMDLNVLPPFRNIGIGSILLEKAELEAAAKSIIVGLAVGLYGGIDGGYGMAQKLYVRQGYIPDGKGITYNYKQLKYNEKIILDDNLTLWFTKKLNRC